VLAGTATTRSDGTYSVSLPMAKLAPEASYGVVNLEADTETAAYSFPVVISSNAGCAGAVWVYNKSLGVFLSDKAGSFDQHGTYSWSTSLKESWPTYGPGRSVWYITQFHWGDYTREGRYVVHPHFEQHVNGYVGGAEIRRPSFIPRTPMRFCTTQAPAVRQRQTTAQPSPGPIRWQSQR
jgi:hypothetical protein